MRFERSRNALTTEGIGITEGKSHSLPCAVVKAVVISLNLAETPQEISKPELPA